MKQHKCIPLTLELTNPPYEENSRKWEVKICKVCKRQILFIDSEKIGKKFLKRVIIGEIEEEVNK